MGVEDNVEAFGLQGFLAQYNGTCGVIIAKQKGGRLVAKFSEFVIDENGELAEKGQQVTLERANCRVPGTGPPPGDKREGRSRSRQKAKIPVSGFSKAKKSRSRSRGRRKRSRSRSRSRSRRRRSPSGRRRRR